MTKQDEGARRGNGELRKRAIRELREAGVSMVEAIRMAPVLYHRDKRIAELENALATSFEFLSLSRPLDNLFYENHKHLIEEQGE